MDSVTTHNLIRTSREQAQRLRLMANELKAEANRLEHRAELMEKTIPVVISNVEGPR